MSRRPDGKRGRRKPDPAEETASWLLEVERAGQPADEEDDWSGTLRATRREATGQFPGVPPQGGERREAPPPMPQAPQRRDPSQESVGGDTGGWRSAPAPREPEPWDTQAGSEPWNGRWPFEETNQSWEPDDRSYAWPAQELPSNTGSWDTGDHHDAWDPRQSGQGSYEPGPQGGGYPTPSPYESSRGYGSPPGYDPTGYEQPRGGYPAGSSPTEGGYEPAARYGQPDGGYEQPPPGQSTGEQPLARPYVDLGGYGGRDTYRGSNGYGPPVQGGYASPDYGQPEQGYAPEPSYDQNQSYGSEADYGQADPGYPPDAGVPPSNSYPLRSGDYATGEFGTGEFRTGEYGTGEYGTGEYGTGEYGTGADVSDSGYPTHGTYPPPSGRFGPESGYRADAGYPPVAPYEPQADAYPPAGGYDNGYNSSDPYATGDPFTPNSSGDPYATGGEPFQIRDPYATGNQPPAPAGATGAAGAAGATGAAATAGAIGANAPGIAGQPSRPDSWPAQTGSWQVDEPVRPRGAGLSGEFSRVRDDDEQVVRPGSIGEAGPRGAGRPDLGVRPRLRDPARPVDADGEHISTRARWPRVIALISWIILLMVICWFYVFPFLERILPENF
jgi:hypothetical protein